MTCNVCKGTGKLALFTSVVDCECQSDSRIRVYTAKLVELYTKKIASEIVNGVYDARTRSYVFRMTCNVECHERVYAEIYKNDILVGVRGVDPTYVAIGDDATVTIDEEELRNYG